MHGIAVVIAVAWLCGRSCSEGHPGPAYRGALRQQGLQSDQRFAESVVRGRIRKGYGPFFIERELGAKGVTSSVVHETEAWQAADWSSLVAEYLERKFPEVGAATENNASDRRQKAARSLQQRGFAATDIRRALFG